MEHLIANQHSKRASSTTPHVISVLQEHSERLLKLEAIVAINTKREIMADREPVESKKIVTKIEPVPIPEPEPVKLAPIVIPEPEPEIPDVEIPISIPDVEIPESLDPEDFKPNVALINEMTNKLADLSQQNTTLNDEIVTLQDLEDQEDVMDSLSDTSSVCTEACKHLIKEIPVNDMVQMGTWKVESDSCKDCIKKRAKAYRKVKQQNEKDRAKQMKQIKQKQKELIKLDQKQLQIKLKNLKKGRPENYGLDDTMTKQDKMRDELRKIAKGYTDLDNTTQFNIQMFV
jgi:hypothetical protein